jgi:uncharacterized protein (DUF2141 family)
MNIISARIRCVSVGRWAQSVTRANVAAMSSLCLTLHVQAAGLEVRVSGLAEPTGRVGCALFSGPAGFPLDNRAARQLWVPADPKGVICRFDEVPAGSHAISVGHDVNGNEKVDTNFVGMPTEQWGVSNNVRPRLRAPRFDEAAFKMPADDEELVLDVTVAK